MSGMAAEIDFQPYLRSISDYYAQWWQLYTLTDAETKARQKNESQLWETPFDFGLMVQTVVEGQTPSAERSPNPNGTEDQDKEKTERFPVLEGIRKYVAEHRQVLLVGRPGSGKSTTLARLLLEEARSALADRESNGFGSNAANGDPPKSPLKRGTSTSGSLFLRGLGGSRGLRDTTKIPVLVELRFWSGSILDRIQAFFQRHGLQLDRTQIGDLLFHRRLLLLMDGLNELPSEAARLDVMKFRQDYPQVSMIFTTRDLSLGGDFGLERKLEMQPLTGDQMKAFVRSYVPEQAEVMLRQLKDRLREFGQTPLLLWMLCGLFRQTGEIPNNLGEVFRAFTQGYEKNLKADVPVESDRGWWSELLQELAFWMMHGVPFGKQAPELDVEFRVAVSKTEACHIFAAFLKNKELKPEGTALKYLEDLLRHHLIQPNGEQVEFRHQLLQEYYAAEYLLAHWEQMSGLEFQQNYLNYLKWTEAIGLMVGLTDSKALASRVVELSLELDWQLGARLAGEAKPQLQKATVDCINALKVAEHWKIELLGKTRSNKAIPILLKALEHEKHLVRWGAVSALREIASEEAILGLLKAFEHKDSHMRGSAASALWEIDSEQAVPGLLNTLANENTEVRWRSAETLGRLGSEQAIPGLVRALEDEHSTVREKAADALGALGRIGSEQAATELVKALEHEDRHVRWRAAYALGALGSEQAIPGLLDALEHEWHTQDEYDYSVLWHAGDALGQLGSEQAIPGLLKALEHCSIYVGMRAAKALRIIGSEQAIPGLLKVLEDKNPDRRRNAAYTLGELGSEQAIPELLKALEHQDSSVRGRAADALVNIDSEEAISGLFRNAFEHENIAVRCSAYNVLWKLNQEQKISRFLNLLEHKDPNVRWSAILSLENSDSKQTISRLLKALEDENSDVRERAASALGKIGSEQTILGLLNTLEDKNPDVRRNAAYTLGKLGSEQAIPELFQALEDENFTVRERAVYALGKLGSEQAVPELLKALEDENPAVRESAVDALGRIGSEQAIPGLVRALEDEYSYVRENAAYALGKLGSEQAVPILVNVLENEYSKNQYSYGPRRTGHPIRAADALRELGSEQLLNALKHALKHKNFYVRESAVDALSKLDPEQVIPELLNALEDENPTVRERAAYTLRNINNIAVVRVLPQLVPIISGWSDQYPFWFISAIHANCKFYNYDIYQAYLEAQKRNQSEGQNSSSRPSTVTYNIDKVGNLNTGSVSIHGNQIREQTP